MTADLRTIDWPAILVLAPVLGAAAAFLWPRGAAAVGLAVTLLAAAASAGLVAAMLAGGPIATTPGGWAAPLGIAMRADGLAALMIAMTAGVGALVALAAADSFGVIGRRDDTAQRIRQRTWFWPLWLLLLAGLNGLYLAADAFNLYITLEIVGLAAVGLTALSGTPASVRAALTYLFAGLLGSLLFLLGVGLLYAAYGRVDLAGLGGVVTASPAASAALVVMLVGLALKTALFPLHFWLPPAHANAVPAASALLSALVVKGSLYLAIRLWLTVFPGDATMAVVLGLLGAGAMLWGSVQALRAARLKLVVAYSTVAQIGLIVLAFAVTGELGARTAWQGAIYLMLAHAVAKAAMFLAVGRIVAHVGHDDIARLDESAVRPGIAQVAFALAAISLVGLPPSGGFVGKWLLLEGTLVSGAWAWTALIAVGTLLTAAYFLRAMAGFLRTDRIDLATIVRPAWTRADLAPIALAVLAAVLGLMASGPLTLLAVDAATAHPGDL